MLARLEDPHALAPAETIAATDRERVEEYMQQARCARTRAAYARDFAAFAAWCASRNLGPLPASPPTVAAYVSHLADDGRAVASIVRALASISVAHHDAGFEDSPTAHKGVRTTMRGIRRTVGVAQRKKAPLVIESLRVVVEPLGASRVDLRDRALLVLGFAAALRRSEIVALDVEDLAFVRDGLEVTIRRSKTDQEGAGVLVAVPYGSKLATCPVRALQAWLSDANITRGPVFRSLTRSGNVRGRLSAQSVALVVKARAGAVGVDGDLSGHSLRAGFATSAANSGVSLVDSMRQTRHKSVAVASGYVRRANAWEKNAAASVGL